MASRYVSTFPSSDPAFRRVVEHLGADRSSTTTDELTRRLRPLYPRVAIFKQQLTGEPERVYVFRDGRYELDRSERWWEEPGVACVIVDVDSGRLTEVSSEYADLMHAPRAELVGRHYSEFLQPEAREAATAMFESHVQDREVSTEALVRRADGTTLRIELHASRRNGEIDVRYRPV